MRSIIRIESFTIPGNREKLQRKLKEALIRKLECKVIDITECIIFYYKRSNVCMKSLYLEKFDLNED